MAEVPSAERMNALLGELMSGINAAAFRMLGNKVVSGPFMGMQIPEKPPWNDGNSSTKLVGSYEFELHDAILKALARGPKSIVNVGCAEGYYAIGLARLAPKAYIQAVDISEQSIEVCREYARLNGVEQQVTVSNCFRLGPVDEPSDVDLFIIDNEGYELGLLRPAKQFINSDIIVECHDFMEPGTSEILVREFLGTHTVEVIEPRIPPFEAYPWFKGGATVMTVLAVAEKRPMPTRWLACWSMRKGNSNGEHRSLRREGDA